VFQISYLSRVSLKIVPRCSPVFIIPPNLGVCRTKDAGINRTKQLTGEYERKKGMKWSREWRTMLTAISFTRAETPWNIDVQIPCCLWKGIIVFHFDLGQILIPAAYGTDLAFFLFKDFRLLLGRFKYVILDSWISISHILADPWWLAGYMFNVFLVCGLSPDPLVAGGCLWTYFCARGHMSLFIVVSLYVTEKNYCHQF